jgi:hypothetical protein
MTDSVGAAVSPILSIGRAGVEPHPGFTPHAHPEPMLL